MLTERRVRLEKDAADLAREQAELAVHLQETVISDTQITEIERFCAEVREGLETATYDKRRCFELLNVRGKFAVEDGEKVVVI